MTKAEERRALLKEQSASMQRSTNVVTNKAQERRKMLSYTQTPPAPALTPTQNAFNILNNANKVQSYNDVTKPVQNRMAEPAVSQNVPTFKTLEEAQQYAKNNNMNVISPSKEQVKQFEVRNTVQPSDKGMVIQLNKEDKDFYLSGNRLNIYKNSMELAENSLKLAEERYNNASESEKELALQELNKAKEKYQEKLKDYTTAVKYDEYYNPLGKHLRNIAGSVSQGVAYVGNYLDRTLEENRNNAIGNSYDNIDVDTLYKYLQNPNDVSLKIKGVNSLVILNEKARTSENAKKLFEELTSGNFKGSVKDLEERIESIRKQDNEDKKMMKNTYDYVETNDEIIQNMNLSDAEKIVYDTEKVIGNMLPTIGAGAINPALGRATLFANANESAFNEALREGASYNQAENYGNIVGGIEFGSEMLFDSTIGKAIGLGGLSSSEPYANYLGNITTNKFGKTIGNIVRGGTNFAGDLVGEAVEEVVSEFANPFAKMATYNPNAPLSTPEQLDKAFTSSLLPTAILGGGAQAINGVNNAVNTQQPVQNVAPQSLNTQIQQQTNEVIPQQNENEENANLVQNNTQIAKKTPNNVQISQNNVQNAQDLQKTGQLPPHIQTFVDNRVKTAPGLNVEIDNTLNSNGMIVKRADGTRTIKINPNSKRAYEFIVVHEMMHDLEGTQEFQELSKYVKDRAITQEGFEKAKQSITNQYTKYYTENNLDMSNLNMDIETTNDMVAQALGNQQFLNELAGNKPNVFMRLYNWIKNVAFDGNNTGKTFSQRRANNKYLQELKNKFEVAYNAAYKGNNGQQFDIITTQDNKQYAKATRQVIKGNDVSKWGEQVEKYINEEIRKGQDVSFYGADGELLTITRDTAGKAKFRNEVTMADGTKRKLTDDEYKAKLEAETHIDELAQISKHKNGPVADTKNHSFAKDGFNYRTAYFEDSDGKYYKITMSVGKNGEINTIYNVGQMKDAQKNRSNTSNRGLKGPSDKIANGSTTSTNIISLNNQTVKNSTQSSFSLGELEDFENKKHEAYKKIADEFGRGTNFWEANLEGLEKESAIRMLKRDTGVQNRFIETHDFEKVYKPVSYRTLATAQTQNFVKENNVSFEELVNNEELTNKFFDVWEKELLSMGDSLEGAKQTIDMWKDYFEAQRYKYTKNEGTMRILKSFESDFGKILSGATQEVDNFETSKKLEKMEAFNRYVESFVNPLYGEKPQLSTEELTELAQDTFGITTDFSVGAYMTPDGKLLDFRDGKSQYRNDHRDIDVIGYNMQEFINAGNIRMKPEGNGFELVQEPTPEQYDTLSEYIDFLDGEVYMEIDIGENKYDGANYKKGTPTSKIINDLQYYFKNGKFPLKSSLADFRYSQSNNEWEKYLDKNWNLMPNSNKTYSLPTQAEQQQAQQELRDKLPTQEKQNEEKNAEILNDTEKSKTPFKELAKEAVNDFKRAFVDAGTDIAEIGKISNDKTLYHKFNSAKQSGQSANYMISEAQTNYQGDTVGKSLMDIFEPIRKKGQDYYKEFEYYMYHLHNIDRMQQGKPVFGKNVTADDSKNIVKEFEAKYPEFPKYAEDIRKWNANLQQFRIDTGLISQEQADIMNEMYPNYVPTYRETNGISGATKSGSIVKIVDTIKKATGSNKNILPLHEQMARQVMQTVQAGRRNVLGMQLYNDAIKNADKLGEYVQEIKTAKEDVETDADFDFEKQDLEGKFVVYDDGKKVEMQVSKGVLEGLKSLSSAKWESNLLSKGMKKVNSTFKKLVTEWNPGFLVKNAVRDIQDAGLYSENVKEFYKNYPQAWKEITSNGELWQKYLAMGGSDASLFDFEQGYIAPKEGLLHKGVEKLPTRLQQTKLVESIPYEGLSRAAIEKVGKANFLVEQAPRFAEFLRIYNQSDKSYNALMEAMYGAADITVNFGRSGTWGKFINNNLVPFFNPAIQGTSKTLRTITGDGNVQGKKNFAKHMANIVGKGVLLGVAPTMINHILLEVFGGDDYDDLNERDKDMYFLIPTGDGQYFKLPKGRVLSVIGGFVRRGFDYATGDKDAYKGFGEFALGQTAPTNPFENSLYAPIQAVKNNTTWYGTPIENQTLQNYRPSQRYDEGTTEFAKGLGKAINYSPKKIDYLIDAYGGAVADVAMPLMTKKAESSGLGKSFTLDSVTSNKLSTDFYDTIEELTYDKNDDDQVAKMQLKYMNDVKEKAQDINKQIKDLHASDLDDKEKLKQVRELRKEVNTLQRDALNTYEKYGELANKYMNDDSVIELALRGTKEDSTEETKQQNIEKTVKLYTDKELFGSEYAMQEYDKRLVEKQKESNFDVDTFFEIYFAQKGIAGDKNTITGKTQEGSEKKKKLDAMHKAVPKLTPWELNKLYDLLN